MGWKQWIPNKKVTAGAVSAALAFVFVVIFDSVWNITAPEAVALGSAVTVIIAYWIPNRKGD